MAAEGGEDLEDVFEEIQEEPRSRRVRHRRSAVQPKAAGVVPDKPGRRRRRQGTDERRSERQEKRGAKNGTADIALLKAVPKRCGR
jgi:hypothetical protein